MNRPLVILAASLSVLALYLSTRTQAFTRVTVDGRSIRMLVAGRGDTTVVFENGLGGPLEHWGKVQPGVSRFARTVSYDRAGAGLSEDGPLPRDGRRIAKELHDALRIAGAPPPYVLVGHSLGGLYIRVFAGIHPDEVSGMVLVDPTHDGDDVGSSTLPELAALRDTVDQARTSQVPPRVSLVLIDALGMREPPFTRSHIGAARVAQRDSVDADARTYRSWVNGIPGGRMIATDQSGHNVPQEQPELVVATIRQVVDETTRRSQH